MIDLKYQEETEVADAPVEETPAEETTEEDDEE